MLYCGKKKWKNGSFGRKPWINPFEKMSIFRVFCTSFFYSLERRFFVLEYRKGHFPMLYCGKKKWKNGSFWSKTMGGKMSIFRLFEILFFLA